MAYYSNQGAAIHSAVGGVGQPQSGPLMAFRDGSLGIPPPVHAFRDGSLGAEAGPLMAYKDGSLGMPLYIDSSSTGLRRIEEPITIIHGDVPAPGPIRGAGEYFSSMGEYFSTSGLGGCTACGQVAQEVVLDMKNPEVVKEVKTAMGIAPFMIQHVSGPATELQFDVAFFENPVWDAEATRFAALYKEEVKAFDPSKAALVDAMFVAPNLFPNAFGITNIMTLAGYPPASAEDQAHFEHVPTLVLFYNDTVGEGKPTGRVIPPFLTLAEQQAGTGIKAAHMVAVGLGVVVIFGVIAIVSAQRRRKR